MSQGMVVLNTIFNIQLVITFMNWFPEVSLKI